MKQTFLTKTRKMTSLIIVSGIIGLSLVSLIPWITYENTYLNTESIANSDNLQIKDLIGNLENVSLCFWLLIIFGLIAVAGLAIQRLGKYSLIAKILILMGCANIVFSILVFIIIHFNVVTNIEEIDSVYGALIFNDIQIKYAYLPIIVSLISLIGSLFYTGHVVSFLIKGVKRFDTGSLPDKKLDDNKKPIFKRPMKKEIEVKKTQREETIELPKPQVELKEPIEPEKKVMITPPPIKETYPKPDLRQPSEPKDPMVQPLISKEEPILPEKPKTPFKEEKTVQPSVPEADSETIHTHPPRLDEKPSTSPLFEKALSSAIEKRQTEILKDIKEKKNESKSNQ